MQPTASRKRPYQPDIAAFFPRAETSLPIREDPVHGTSHVRVSPQSQLPAYVQSSLLNVGMRIRKAVPEGYRRQKMLEVEMSVGDKENYGSKAVSGISSSSARELQPFAYCSPSHERSNALHEIGGWGAQPTSHYAKPVAPGYTDEDSFPSSQLSSSSTASIPAKAKGKRVFEDDDADDESEPSNMSAPPNAFSHIMQQHPWGRSRGLRGKRRVFASRAARPMAPVPNFIPDFEEADFLRSRDDETMDTS